jgi:hypothetical protein
MGNEVKMDEVKAADAGFFEAGKTTSVSSVFVDRHNDEQENMSLIASLLAIISRALKEVRAEDNVDLEIDIICSLDKLNFCVEWRGSEPTICDKGVYKALDVLFREGNGHVA